MTSSLLTESPLPTTGMGWIVLIFGAVVGGGGAWNIGKSLIDSWLNRTTRTADIAHKYAIKDQVNSSTHVDREKWVQELVDKELERKDRDLDKCLERVGGLQSAAWGTIEVFDPLVMRMRPDPATPDADSKEITVHVTEYLAGRDALHDIREHLR